MAMVVETAAYSAITPLLPHLVDEYGLSKAAAGVLTAAYPVGTLALSLPAAWVSARVGPKRTVVAALLLLALATLAFALVRSSALLTLARLLQGAAAGAVWAGGLAWVVAVAPRERRAEAMGTVIGAAIAGALGGPVIGAIADAAGMTPVFCVYAAVPALLALGMLRQAAVASVPGPGVAAVRAALAEPLVRRGMWLMALPAIAYGLFNTLVPLQLDDLGAGAAAIGAVFLASVAVESVVSPVAGRLSDRRGPAWPARIGLFGGGLTLVVLPLAATVLLVGAVLVLASSLLGLLWAPAMALVSDGAEARDIDPSFGFGLGNVAWGLGSALGGSGGGALANGTSDVVPYVVLSVAAVLTSLALRPARTRGRAAAWSPSRGAP